MDDTHNDDMYSSDVLHNKPVDDNMEVLYDSIQADDSQVRDEGASVVEDAVLVDAELVVLLAMVVVSVAADADELAVAGDAVVATV
jgi:hypothetical protein